MLRVFILVFLCLTASCQLLKSDSVPPASSSFDRSINASDFKQYVYYLASEDMLGRDTGSVQENIYQPYLVSLLKKWGLAPAGDNGTYRQKFDLVLGVELGKRNYLKVNGKMYKVGEDWLPTSFSKLGKLTSREVVFVGYGIKAPAQGKFKAYDSYKGVNVKGKWVMAFRYVPEKLDGDYKVHLNMYAKIQYKAMVAKEQGAKGLIIVTGPNAHAKSDLIKLRYEGGVSNFSITVISVTDKLAQKMLGRRSLQSLQSKLDSGEKVGSFKLPKVKLCANVDLHHKNGVAHNVLAMLKVKGARQTIMIGAHGDHLGKGKKGNSLMTKDDITDIHFGADDNASGVAGVMELAHYLSDKYKKNPQDFKYNILFAIWSGEEIGLLGSHYFVENWKKNHHYPLEKSVIAYLNMDMIGRYRGALYLQGVASSDVWLRLVKKFTKNDYGIKIQTQADPYVPSDGMSFYIGRVPSITFFTGSHSEYHTPRDKADTLNYKEMVGVAALVKDFALALESGKYPVHYRKLKGKAKNSRRGSRKFRVYLGTIPAYGGQGGMGGKVKGVLLAGATDGSPADRAGIKKGDIIIELNGKKFENIYDFVYALQTLTPDVETSITVMRNGKPLKLRITPRAKE